jgi:hypothetical protein
MVMTDLRSNVIWSSTERSCQSITNNLFFAHSEVCYFDMSFTVQHYVVQFQISVNQFLVMQ